MVTRRAVLLLAIALAAVDARAQTTTATPGTAGEALRNISFGSPNSRTGALENSADVLYTLLLGETISFPIGSSAGGFTWVFDSTLRLPVRRSRSFGPLFAERPFTTGKGRLNAGISFQHTSFSTVGDQSLSDIEHMWTSNFGSTVESRTSSFDVAIDRTIVSATYGVHDRVDVGVIVPVGRARVQGFSASRLVQQGAVVVDERENSSRSSFGVGDVVVRGKATLSDHEQFSTAVALDLRLPTGDTEKLLGAGAAQTRVAFIVSANRGNVNPHVNVGYTFGDTGMAFDETDRDDSDNPALENGPRSDTPAFSPSQEFGYTVGADIAVTPRLTVAGDVIGRVVRDSANMARVEKVAPEVDDPYTLVQVLPGTVHKLLGAVGAKVGLGGSWLLTGTVLFPLNNNGIKPAVTPVIGVERAF